MKRSSLGAAGYPSRSVVDGGKHRVLLFVRTLPCSCFVVVVGADQLPIKRFAGPVVTPLAGQNGVMDGQSVLMDVAGAAAFLIALAERHRLALHPARIDQPAMRRHPFRCWGVHRLVITAQALSLRRTRMVVQSPTHDPCPRRAPGLRPTILLARASGLPLWR